MLHVNIEYDDRLRALIEQALTRSRTWFQRLPRAARAVVLFVGLFAPPVILLGLLRLPIPTAAAGAVAVIVVIGTLSRARRSTPKSDDVPWTLGLRQTLALDAEYLELRQDEGWTRHAWSKIVRLQHAPELLLVHIDARSAIPVAAFAFATPGEFDQFCRLARQWFEAARQSPSANATVRRVHEAPGLKNGESEEKEIQQAEGFGATCLPEGGVAHSALAIEVLSFAFAVSIYAALSADLLSQLFGGAATAVVMAGLALLLLDLHGRLRRGRPQARRVTLAIWEQGLHGQGADGADGPEWLLPWHCVDNISLVGRDAVVQGAPLAPGLAVVHRFRFPHARAAEAFVSAASASRAASYGPSSLSST